MIDLTGVPELQEVLPIRQEVAEALKLAKENLPPYPTKLLEELGAYIGEKPQKQGRPRFRPWQWKIGNCWNGMIPNNVSCSLEEGYWRDDIDLSDISYCGIWVGRTASKTHLIYCIIPSMNYGEVPTGATFEVGEPFIRIGWKQEDLDAMVKQGYEIMMKMIAEHGEYREEA